MTPYDYDADTSRFCSHGHANTDDEPCPICADMALDRAVWSRMEDHAFRAQENRIEFQFTNRFERGVSLF